MVLPLSSSNLFRSPLSSLIFWILQDDGIEVRSGALGLRQLGVSAAHCKLDSFVANFFKVLCGQEIYKYCSWHSRHFY